jgi:hypothetical protein
MVVSSPVGVNRCDAHWCLSCTEWRLRTIRPEGGTIPPGGGGIPPWVGELALRQGRSAPGFRVSPPGRGGCPLPGGKARPLVGTAPPLDGRSAPKRGAFWRPGGTVAELGRIVPGPGQTVHESRGKARRSGRITPVRIDKVTRCSAQSMCLTGSFPSTILVHRLQVKRGPAPSGQARTARRNRSL